jgi:peptide deformylase
MAGYDIRIFGDPVLRQVSPELTNIDGATAKLVEDMIPAMYKAQGLGLAAPQIGVQQRLFVYDLHDERGPQTLINPVIKESSGEWTYDEGCLSVPNLSWEIVRPKEIHLVGLDLDGNEVDIQADELLSRLFQHELDHLDGKLLIDYLDDDRRKEALKVLRNRLLDQPAAPTPTAEVTSPKRRLGLSLPGR